MKEFTIAASYLSSIDLAIPFDENLAIKVAPKLPAVIFFYTTPEELGMDEVMVAQSVLSNVISDDTGSHETTHRER